MGREGQEVGGVGERERGREGSEGERVGGRCGRRDGGRKRRTGRRLNKAGRRPQRSSMVMSECWPLTKVSTIEATDSLIAYSPLDCVFDFTFCG